MSRALPQEEIAIATHLLMFREERMMNRTAMAVALGIGSERLASYESARVPLPYGVFDLLWDRFSLHPQLLATGTRPSLIAALPFECFTGLADKRALFSVVYREKIQPLLTKNDPEKADRCWTLDRALSSYGRAVRERRVSPAEAAWVHSMLGEIADVLGECDKPPTFEPRAPAKPDARKGLRASKK